ncbi:pyridoxamine 5'-phosphate oxidase family protein [Halieaceae bacterium]|nr:pyridoxamine 5'-phosphate oxidase family protein [Halieaceae bacterium]
MLPLKAGAVWTAEQTADYLARSEIPMRLACNSSRNYPLICSLWYIFDGEAFWCASHKNSKIIQCLDDNPKCAFEIAADTPPYSGVRGQGDATITKNGAEEILNQLLLRYLDDNQSSLAKWLMSRVADEYVIKIKPRWINVWDYTDRMES